MPSGRAGRQAGPLPPAAPDTDRFLGFAFAAADLLAEVTPDGRVTFAAGAYRSRLGRMPEEVLGRQIQEFVAPEDRPALTAALALLPARGRLAPTVIRLADARRSAFAVAGMHLAATDQRGEGRLCLTFGPVPEPLEPSPALVPAAAFRREAETRLRQAGRGEGAPHDLTLIEVTGAGSAGVIETIGGALAEAGEAGAVAGRIADGRFGLVQGAATPGSRPEPVSEFAERLESLLQARGLACTVEAHRIALAAGDGLSLEQAERALRGALGAFARGGGGALREAGLGEAGLAGYVVAAISRAGTLRRAIDEGCFHLEFQPIADLGDGSVHHHEALLRPDRQPGSAFASPQEFVLATETAGLASHLDLAVVEAALRAAQAAGGTGRVAVNLSALSLPDPGFRTRLLALIDREAQAHARLMIEMTETAEIEDEGGAVATAGALRARGIPFCIDDFGAGAAAFRYLRSFGVDYVKVDGLYVRNAVRMERDRSFVSAMVDLSLAVGARVIAEQVETEEDAAVMRGLGVHYGQGWLFGRPARLGRPAAARTVPRRRQGIAKEQWG